MLLLFFQIHFIISDSLIQDISIKDVLIFVTGASAIPPLGMEPSPKICFVDLECLPFASSCENVIYFPRSLRNYSVFKERTIFALCGSHGFGN